MKKSNNFKDNLVNTLWLYILCFSVMWGVYFVNNVLAHGALTIGILPRHLDMDQIVAIFSSWAFHANKAHIVGNSITLSIILWALPVLEKKPFSIFWLLIFLSGSFTWLIAFSGTSHIGASGLIYALFGYIITQAIYSRKFSYILLSAVLVFHFYASFFSGLVPQKEISLAAHFGGFIAGILVSYMLHEKPTNKYFSQSNTNKSRFFNIFQKK